MSNRGLALSLDVYHGGTRVGHDRRGRAANAACSNEIEGVSCSADGDRVDSIGARGVEAVGVRRGACARRGSSWWCGSKLRRLGGPTSLSLDPRLLKLGRTFILHDIVHILHYTTECFHTPNAPSALLQIHPPAHWHASSPAPAQFALSLLRLCRPLAAPIPASSSSNTNCPTLRSLVVPALKTQKCAQDPHSRHSL